MARKDKYKMMYLENYFREQLLRELSQMFKWKNLPTSIPEDYLERTLVRYGYALFYYDDVYGEDILRCSVVGYNRHNQPTTARTYTPNTENETFQITRRIKRLSDGASAVENFDKVKDGVLIQNMEYGQNMQYIVDFYARRLALSQNAFDNSLTWANIPYIFLTEDADMKLSIERMFEAAQEGKPFTIVDKNLFVANKDRAGVPTSVTFLGKELMDTHNEIMMKFREAVGFNTAGVDKAERVNTLEIKSNDEHTYSVLQIMLKQRKMACDSINAFFPDLNISVGLAAEMDNELIEFEDEEGEEYGGTDNGIEASSETN